MVDAGNRSPRTTPHPPKTGCPSESSVPWPQSQGGTRLGQDDLRERFFRMSRLCENPTYTQCCTTRIQRSSFGVTGSLRKHWSRWPAKKSTSVSTQCHYMRESPREDTSGSASQTATQHLCRLQDTPLLLKNTQSHENYECILKKHRFFPEFALAQFMHTSRATTTNCMTIEFQTQPSTRSAQHVPKKS